MASRLLTPAAARSHLLVLTLVIARPALAQSSTFSDGFESGTVTRSDAPTGNWTAQNVGTAPGTSLNVTAAAAHQGAFGLRFVDTDSGASAGSSGPAAVYAFTDVSGEYHFRFWIRISGFNSQGHVQPAMVHGSVPNQTLAELMLENPGPVLVLSGFNVAGTFDAFTTAAVMSANAWHEVELVVRGVGTSAGARELWYDGQLAASMTGIDWTGATLNKLVLGGPYQNLLFTGTIDLDDAQSSPTPFPASDGGLESPDAGVDDAGATANVDEEGIRRLNVGCSCQQLPAPLFLTASLFAPQLAKLFRRSRTRRRALTEHPRC